MHNNNNKCAMRYESCSLTDDSSSCCSSDSSYMIDPISAAAIAGSSEEFRLFQEELRKSRMVTAGGAKQLMKAYVEKQGRSIERKQHQDPKLSKVKSWKLTKQQSARNLKKSIDQGLQNLRKIFIN
mmetsp:Transcript_23446/g.35587  ORF Transcript_23446/g.35587 Transcript_23446/m.35587 type:complete len:126 (+) Transcript_23446:535-912(+)